MGVHVQSMCASVSICMTMCERAWAFRTQFRSRPLEFRASPATCAALRAKVRSPDRLNSRNLPRGLKSQVWKLVCLCTSVGDRFAHLSTALFRNRFSVYWWEISDLLFSLFLGASSDLSMFIFET